MAMLCSAGAWAASTNQRISMQTFHCFASYTQPGTSLEAINDGNTLDSGPFWSAYRSEGHDVNAEEYVELLWTQRCHINQSQVVYKASGDTLKNPVVAYLKYWNGTEWVTADTLSAARSNVSRTNHDFDTNRLRLYMKLADGASVGLREFTVTGYPYEECEAPTLQDDNAFMTIGSDEHPTLIPELTMPAGALGESVKWIWLDSRGETISTESSLYVEQGGEYVVLCQRECGSAGAICYTIEVDGNYDPKLGYQWPAYSPTLDYDFRTEYPSLPAPTKGRLPENVGVAREVHGEWWSVAVGKNANKLISDTSMVLLAKKMDEDFAYFRNEMGWPPDKRARNGYYSQVYGYGSGLSFDAGTPNTATGGWQSATTYNGSSWPMVFLSYYPIYSFDPTCTYSDRVAQQNACVHEGIHATFADLEGCKQSAWFHEGGNTWLQGEAEVRKSGVAPSSMGFLSAGNMIAPFMPIECYSGWLQDNTFGGPSAEGVNMYNGGQQVCTWRNLLGGVQYGELFPHFCSEILGKGSIPWIWRYCKTRVLEGMSSQLGDKQMRRLILEYRSRQAMIDVGMWSKASEKLIDDNWLLNIKEEWSPYWKKCEEWRATPYAKMTAVQSADSTGWYAPEWRTTPGWSGANQVPIHVTGVRNDTVSITFAPKDKNMMMQLCFRTRAGKIYYSMPISAGTLTWKLPDYPANKVIIAVICNTDYIYEGEQTRKKHFDYRLRMGKGAYKPAGQNYKWYKYAQTISDGFKESDYTGIGTAQTDEAAAFGIQTARTVVHAGDRLPITFTGISQWQVPVQLFAPNGQLVYQQSFLRDGDYELPATLVPGVYLLQAVNGKQKCSKKIVIK